MGALDIAPFLKHYAQEVPEDRTIVEVGSWLGAGTKILAESSICDLHVYDRFQANSSEVTKAEAFGIEIQNGQDTLPLVREYLRPYKDRVHFYKHGMSRWRYDGPTIGLYVDDATKRLWPRMEAVFAPFFDEETVMVMMDYHYSPCTLQRKALKRHKVLVDHVKGTSTRILQWRN